MTQVIETIRWLSITEPEASLSSPDSDGYDANEVRQRPIRIADGLWDDYGIVAKALGSDRSALIRDFIRWITYDETVDTPRRPDIRPAGLRYTSLPDGVLTVKEGEVRQISKPKIRYIVRIDATVEQAREVLIGIDDAVGVMYTDTSPVQISSFDREQIRRIHQAFTEAGLTIVQP